MSRAKGGGLPVGQRYPNHSHVDVRADLTVAAQLFTELDAFPGKFAALPGYTSSGLGVPRDSNLGLDPLAEEQKYTEMCAPGAEMNPNP
jgi:hypothetical protein